MLSFWVWIFNFGCFVSDAFFWVNDFAKKGAFFVSELSILFSFSSQVNLAQVLMNFKRNTEVVISELVILNSWFCPKRLQKQTRFVRLALLAVDTNKELKKVRRFRSSYDYNFWATMHDSRSSSLLNLGY